MFIQTEAMPSPADLKFLPGCEILAGSPVRLQEKAQAAGSPLAQRLVEIPGDSAVTLGADFITVTKDAGEWQLLKPAILGVIVDHLASGAPVIKPGPEAAAMGEAGGLAEDVTDALCRVIDPELGYNIVGLGLVYDVAIEEGVARVSMTTTTRGCPATNYLMEGARDAAGSVPGIEAVEVELTYDPPWSPAMMSPEAKVRFGIRDGEGW